MPLLHDATMDLKSLFALLSMAILVKSRAEIPDSTNDNETIQPFSSSSLCFGRYDNLQNEFCNFKINNVEEKLSAKLNECDYELTRWKISLQEQHKNFQDKISAHKNECDLEMRTLKESLQQQNLTFQEELLVQNNTCDSTLNSLKSACELREISLQTNLTAERNQCDSNISDLKAAFQLQLDVLQNNCSASRDACNSQINQLQNMYNIDLAKKQTECDSTVAALKSSFAQQEKIWIESRLCSVTIREIARRRYVDCKFPKGSENWLQLSTGFYYFSKHHEVVNWHVADANCKIMGMQLATIETAHENNVVINHLNTLGAPDRAMFWISGTDLGAEGRFVWSTTGQRIGFSQFHRGQPDNMRRRENCLQYYKVGSFAWNDYECDKGSRYICELQY
ncbi:low affinity immunoglobulin epsilon Fc receptor-like [Cloeon dipterum]|uniref:low affinity immunoglobulin epsilon Fc receptor-like n=1 Tax=Cloeon dipterum TaxID=197152 RepID=UPI003220419F